MAGRFVSGGFQHNILQKREEESKGQDGKFEGGQYETFSKKDREQPDIDYEAKLAEASQRIAKKTTTSLIEAANEEKNRRRDHYNAKIDYNKRMEEKREQEKEMYGSGSSRDRYDSRDRHDSRGSHDRDDRRSSSRYDDRDRERRSESSRDRDRYSSRDSRESSRRDDRDRFRGPSSDWKPPPPRGHTDDRGRETTGRPEGGYDVFGKHSRKAEQAKDKFKDSEGYVTARTGFRYIPRDPNAPIAHAEVKGWLHCWCQTKNFDKPVYEIQTEGRPPRQKFTVSLTVMTKRGEPLDIKPTVVDRSKKMACTNAAWAFVDEMVKRGLLTAEEAPKREESEMKTTTSGITDCTALDTSEEATLEGGGWTLTNCMLRLRKFCQMVKVPMEIQMHAYGPDHDRKTDAHFTMRFQVMGEKEVREYSCQHTTRNKKQAQAAVSLSMMRALYKDGFMEGYRCPFRPPPRVIYSMSSSGPLDPNDKEMRELYGGWLPANSSNGLAMVMKHWRINPDIPCESVGRPGKDVEVYFKCELRIQLVMQTQNQFKTKHELYAYGKQKSKKDAQNQCACTMMRYFYKFGIVQQAHQSINRPGPNAHIWMIKPGQEGASYTPDDVYVMNKLNDLRPDPKELAYPSTVVGHIEAALKCVSDWVHEEELQQGYQHAINNKRTLLGMQRVGPIAMDMMLTGERRAHVVLTCGRRPTRGLLDKVCGKTIQMLQYTERTFSNFAQRKEELEKYWKQLDEAEGVEKKEPEEKKEEGENKEEGAEENKEEAEEDEKPTRVAPEYYNVQLEHQNSGYLVTYGIVAPHKMVVRVTLTSSLLRQDQQATEAEEKKVKEEMDGIQPAKRPKKEASGDATDGAENKDGEEKPEGGEEAFEGEKKPDGEEVKKEPTPAPSGWATVPDEPKSEFPTDDEKASFKYGPYATAMTSDECTLMEKEEGALPTQPGLGALAEMRRIKWFQHIGLNTPYLPDICRLMRGLAIRETSWRSFRILCPWTIALILEVLIRYEVNANSGSPITLSPARVVNLVLESVGKGFRFPVPVEKKKEDIDTSDVDKIISSARDSSSRRESKRYTHKLVDPCESGTDYDALAHISSTRKADIRACAKYAVDMISRRQISLLLNTGKVDDLDKL